MPSNNAPSPSFPVGLFYARIGGLRHFRPTVEDCFPWLRERKLLLGEETEPTVLIRGDIWSEIRRDILLGVPVQRCTPQTQDQVRRLQQEYKSRPRRGDGPDLESPQAIARVWENHKVGRDRILALEISPVPADAIACYLPFHLDPAQWGIYISVARLLEHSVRLLKCFAGKLYVLGNLESVVRCVLFEIFHHEFFHHMVESAATTLEILSAAIGSPRAIYREYFVKREYEGKLGSHPHEPLEEALANAYAHNAFSFISRVKLGYRTIEARCYQEVMRKTWPLEDPGYRDAGHYAGPNGDTSDYVKGAAQLLAMLLATEALDIPSLLLVSRHVMPRGHTAFAQKAQVPVFLVGSREVLNKFFALVPTPNETYTELFWVRDTTQMDRAMRDRQREQMPKKA